jgi:hypothetical protein
MVTAWVTAGDPWMTLLQPTCCNLQNRPSQACFTSDTMHRTHCSILRLGSTAPNLSCLTCWGWCS